MERVEVPISGETERWVEAIERGDEVVLTRDGRAVLEVKKTGSEEQSASIGAGTIDWEALRRLHSVIPDELRGQGAEMIRELRESYRY